MQIYVDTTQHRGKTYYEWEIQVEEQEYIGINACLEGAFEGIMATLRSHEARKLRKNHRTEY